MLLNTVPPHQTTITCDWPLAAHVPELREDEVHLARAFIDPADSVIPHFCDILAPDELARADRIVANARRTRFIITRGLLRSLLSAYLDVFPSAIRFVYGERGKPLLAAPYRHLHFNVAHSGSLALFAVSLDRHIGVDLERIRDDCQWDDIAEHVFCRQARQALLRLPANRQRMAFFQTWSRREAYAKMLGTGVFSTTEPLNMAERLADDECSGLAIHDEDPEVAARVALGDIHVAAGFVASLAVSGPPWRLRSWQCPVPFDLPIHLVER